MAPFLVDDVMAEYDRLTQGGVAMGVFDDTCGHLIQIVDRNRG